MNEAARKNDQGKPDLSLIPRIALVRLAEALEVGARKYSRYNYCAGLEVSRQVGALMRHVAAWMDGEEFDPQDGQHHLGSAMANCAMILHEMELGTLKDDRYRKPVAATAPAVEVEAKPKLQLRVGGKYRRGNGRVVTIISREGVEFDGHYYPYAADNGQHYAEDGTFLFGVKDLFLDLVEEIVEETDAKRAFNFLEVGKTYLRRDGKTRTIVEYIPTAEYPYVDEDRCHYLPSGRWASDESELPTDLIAETVPSVPKAGGTSLTKEGPASTPEGGGA